MQMKLFVQEKNLWYDKEMSAVRTQTLFPELLVYDGSLSVQYGFVGLARSVFFLLLLSLSEHWYASAARTEGAV